MLKSKQSSKKVIRYQPIYILRDGMIIAVTTKSRTQEHAKRRYCEQNDIGGPEALRLSTLTLKQLMEQKNVQSNTSG